MDRTNSFINYDVRTHSVFSFLEKAGKKGTHTNFPKDHNFSDTKHVLPQGWPDHNSDTYDSPRSP